MRWLTPKSGGLAVVILLVVIGIGFWIVGARHWADICWAIVTVAMLVVVLTSLIRVALRRELGVDLIALVALGGSLALGEYLAGAVIGSSRRRSQRWRRVGGARPFKSAALRQDRHSHDGNLPRWPQQLSGWRWGPVAQPRQPSQPTWSYWSIG